MNFLWHCSALLLIVLLGENASVEGGRIVLRPMSAQEVYRVLRQAGREDAIPEGRVVTQGISALTGFTLGLAKGIGGAALVGALAGGGVSLASMLGQGSSSSGTAMTTQEICFNSRSLDGGELAAQGRQTGTADTGTIGTTAATSPTTSGTSPSATTDTGVGDTGTNTDNGSGSGTASETTTQTGGEGSTNCLVIQKPTSG